MTSSNQAKSQEKEMEGSGNLEICVSRELSNSDYPCFRQLSCLVRGGVLVLKGQVPTYYLKQLAQTVVRPHLQPAMVVDNQIVVRK